MELGKIPLGVDARVLHVHLDPGVRFRLGELGLRRGAVLRVTHRAAFGGRVVAIGADRFAVDGRTSALIDVEAETAP